MWVEFRNLSTANFQYKFYRPNGTLSMATPVVTISDVFAAVERENADLGVVPVENTTEGVITQTLDTFVDCDVSICGEILMRISNDLASKTGKIEDVKQVVEHLKKLGWDEYL